MSTQWFRTVTFALLALALTGASACETTEDPMMMDDDDFTVLYNSTTFQMCVDCHAPGAPGFVQGTETTQDWTSRATAYTSLQGNAAGLEGNFAGCNGVPLIGDTPETSLIVAVFDQDVRANFSLAAFPDCDGDAIADETLRVGAIPAGTLTLLKSWISNGAPNM